MSPRRSNSPQPSREAQSQSKSKPAKVFHLGNLPRFHPAAYQSSGSSHPTGAQPPSPRQSRHNYRAGSRDIIWQYRELIEGTHPGPAAPRLDPLASPGPVTPLTLEASDYLAHGSVSNASDRTRDAAKQSAGPPPELVEKLIAQEKNARQIRKSATR